MGSPKEYPGTRSATRDYQSVGPGVSQMRQSGSGVGDLTPWRPASLSKPQQSSTSQGFQGRLDPRDLGDPSRILDGSISRAQASRILLAALRLMRIGVRLNPLWSLAIEILLKMLENWDGEWSWSQRNEGKDWSGITMSCGTSSGRQGTWPGANTTSTCESFFQWKGVSGFHWGSFRHNLQLVAGKWYWRHSTNFFEAFNGDWTPSTIGGTPAYNSKISGLGYYDTPYVNPMPPFEVPDVVISTPSNSGMPNWGTYDPDWTKPGDPPVGDAPPVKDWDKRGGSDSGYGERSDGGSSSGQPPWVPSRPPGRGTKERKVKVVAGGWARVIIDAISEQRDFIRALWDALPKEAQHAPHRKRPWPYKSEQPKMQDMLKDLWDYWPNADLSYFNRAFDKVVENEIEDWFYGKIGKAQGQAAAQIGRPVGFQTGWAL